MGGLHRVVLEFDGGGISATLTCPTNGDGCHPAMSCSHCGRDYADPEATRCYDCKDADPDECWIKTWFDNESAEDLLHGSVEISIDAEWDMDHLVARIVDPALASEGTPEEAGDV
jgi:hypothetical protein